MNEITTNSNHMKIMTVNTRRGPLQFQTNLSWEDACTTLINICERTDFVDSLADRIKSNKYMSDAQVAWVYYLSEKAWAPKPQPTSVKGDEILAALAQAYAKGIKKPMVRLGNGLRAKFTRYGKNPDGAWLTLNGNLVGQIDCNGDCVIYNNSDDLLQTITNINSNFEGHIRDQGLISGQCMCCGLPLTNELSLRIGIGPICREKYFG